MPNEHFPDTAWSLPRVISAESRANPAQPKNQARKLPARSRVTHQEEGMHADDVRSCIHVFNPPQMMVGLPQSAAIHADACEMSPLGRCKRRSVASPPPQTGLQHWAVSLREPAARATPGVDWRHFGYASTDPTTFPFCPQGRLVQFVYEATHRFTCVTACSLAVGKLTTPCYDGAAS
jgi:hypothetical protein